MKKQQLYTRLGPDVVERVIRRFNERNLTMIEESVLRYGLPEAYYTDGFSMFGKEGEDLCSPETV